MQCMTKRTEQVNIRLDPDTKAELASIAAEEHRTLSNLIVAVLMDFLAKRRIKKQ
jgi:uncharacterized protein (DUF1778 family)